MKIKHSTSTIVNPQENPYSEDLGPPPSPTHIIKAAVVASPTGKHPLYKGIRSRGMKWVSEIREPHKTTRIWLGTYATPEMAAAAYDAASLALKGPETVLNFPHHKYNNYNVNLLFPASTPTAAGIRMAAANAAASRAVESESLQVLPAAQNTNNNNINVYSNISSNALLWNNEEYVDEEELYYMPNLLMNMAEGMLISPPRDAVVLQPSSGDEEEFMWSYS